MLEYPEKPQYLNWHQTKPITSPCGDVGYELVSGNGSWIDFNGLHSNRKKSLFNGQKDCSYWMYAIGATSYEYQNYFPGYINSSGKWVTVQYADLWIELKDLNSLNFLKPLNCICTYNAGYTAYNKLLYIAVILLIYDS